MKKKFPSFLILHTGHVMYLFVIGCMCYYVLRELCVFVGATKQIWNIIHLQRQRYNIEEVVDSDEHEKRPK